MNARFAFNVKPRLKAPKVVNVSLVAAAALIARPMHAIWIAAYPAGAR
jgi:hypothetical protein